jgi:hypothetical protein
MEPAKIEVEEFVRTHNGGMAVRCHALVNNRQCNAFAVKGRKFCNKHGGKALAGIESPSFTTGLHSIERKRFKSVGRDLLKKIDDLREDPDLFSLKDDAAYLTALIDRRAELAAEGLGVQVLKELQSEWSVANRALREGSMDVFSESFGKIGQIINDGIGEAKATDEVVELIGKRVSLVEAEQRVAHAKAYTLEVDQAYSLVMQVVQIVKQSVRNADELASIKAGITRLLRVYKEEEHDVVDAEVITNETE